MSKRKNVKEEAIKEVEKDVNKVEETEVTTPETTDKKSKKEIFKNFTKKAKRCAKFAVVVGAVAAAGIGALALFAVKMFPDTDDAVKIKGENGEDLYLIAPKGYLDGSDETSKDDDKDEN